MRIQLTSDIRDRTAKDSSCFQSKPRANLGQSSDSPGVCIQYDFLVNLSHRSVFLSFMINDLLLQAPAL